MHSSDREVICSEHHNAPGEATSLIDILLQISQSLQTSPMFRISWRSTTMRLFVSRIQWTTYVHHRAESEDNRKVVWRGDPPELFSETFQSESQLQDRNCVIPVVFLHRRVVFWYTQTQGESEEKARFRVIDQPQSPPLPQCSSSRCFPDNFALNFTNFHKPQSKTRSIAQEHFQDHSVYQQQRW